VKENKEIGKLLRENFESKTGEINNHIKLPSGINIFSDKNKVTLEMKSEIGKGIFGNMQKDDAAFEAWCLIVRHWISEFKTSEFTLRWEKPLNGDENEPHYQRFLYRVENFKKLFGWFTLDSYYTDILEQDSKIKKEAVLFLNRPNDTRREPYITATDTSFDALDENDIERIFSCLDGPRKKLAIASGADAQTKRKSNHPIT
jgi:hypothetical protein